MIKIEPTFDSSLIADIISHPAIYRHVSDDYSPPASMFHPGASVGHPGVHFLLVKDGDEVLGLYMVHMHNPVMWEVHTCLLPNAWGERAKMAGYRLIGWVFQQTTCKKLITLVPQTNRIAKKYAEDCGLKVEGIITKSYMKNGRLLDQYLLGIERQEEE